MAMFDTGVWPGRKWVCARRTGELVFFEKKYQKNFCDSTFGSARRFSMGQVMP
jgi:hypothetical protein